jgi:hypothetical protein
VLDCINLFRDRGRNSGNKPPSPDVDQPINSVLSFHADVDMVCKEAATKHKQAQSAQRQSNADPQDPAQMLLAAVSAQGLQADGQAGGSDAATMPGCLSTYVANRPSTKKWSESDRRDFKTVGIGACRHDAILGLIPFSVHENWRGMAALLLLLLGKFGAFTFVAYDIACKVLCLYLHLLAFEIA